MNKKIISLLATGAVVATAAGSFAAWDTLSDSTSATITFGTPIVISPTLAGGQTAQTAPGVLPVASADLDINTTGSVPSGSKITFVTELKDGSTTIDPSLYDLVITDDNDSNSVVTSGDLEVTNTNNYTVKVTPKDDSAATTAFQGKTIDLKITATLGK